MHESLRCDLSCHSTGSSEKAMTDTPPIKTSIARVTPAFLLGAIARVLQGFAVFAPVAICVKSDVDWGIFTPTAIAAAAVTSGMGLGSGLDRSIRGIWGTAIVVRISLLILAAGLWMLWLKSAPEFTVAIAFLLGLVAGTEWSSLADVSRKTLHNTVRWQGVRIWTVAFIVGVAIAVTMHLAIAITTFFAALAASLVFSMSLLIDLTSTEDLDTELPPNEVPPPEVPVQTPDEILEAPSTESGEECDATECCGGNKPWQQTPFAHGVLLSSVGWFALFGCLRLLSEQSWILGDTWPTVLLSGGMTLGGLLIFSVAPATGYTVALLPFLLLAIVLTLCRQFVVSAGLASAVTLFASGTALGAVHCGVKLVVGELFSDCSTDPLRTRIVAVSLFATSVIVPGSVMLEHLLPSGTWQAIPSLIILVSGIATLRSLPSPVVSSLGEDNPDEPDRDELEDVMAAINN